MARKKVKKITFYSDEERIIHILSSMKIKDLKQAAVARSMDFMRVTIESVLEIQSWLIKHWEDPIDKTLLNDYDEWMENDLREQGLDELCHPQLRLGYFGEDEDGNEIRKQIKNIGIPNIKSKKELSQFKPKKGSMKALVFQIIRSDPEITTAELIEDMQDRYPDAQIGSIKSWASRARKAVRYGEELDS